MKTDSQISPLEETTEAVVSTATVVPAAVRLAGKKDLLPKFINSDAGRFGLNGVGLAVDLNQLKRGENKAYNITSAIANIIGMIGNSNVLKFFGPIGKKLDYAADLVGLAAQAGQVAEPAVTKASSLIKKNKQEDEPKTERFKLE